ncbi:hypothetical protein FACS189494_01210 [Spirochaetia bacterium]|nr:hypothetical protein FACS189494_01210 [Spirochaetia bacterium]
MPAAQAVTALSDREINERVAILKRFRSLLLEQKSRFVTYLDVLDKQKTQIEEGSGDLEGHIELEEKLVSDILSIQKTITPMQPLYKAAWKGGAPEITEITRTLETLKAETARRAAENKNLLQQRMTELKQELKTLAANPFKKRRPVYGDNAQPMLIDIKG